MVAQWIALILAVLANLSANIAFKKAAQAIGNHSGPVSLLRVLETPWFWVGGGFCVLLLGSYLFAIRIVELPVAYAAVTGLSLIGLTVVSVFVFDAHMSLQRIIGVLFVCAGIVLLNIGGK